MKPERLQETAFETKFDVFAKSMRLLGYVPGQFSKEAPLFLAVSGGADSLFLALCARSWLERVGNRSSCVALVVDHGLRENSEEQADETVAQLGSWGIKAHKLTWARAAENSSINEKLDKKISEARSRAARYALINDFIEAFVFKAKTQEPVLLTGHHADDQVETFLLRLERKSGVYGLAGMSANVRQDGHVFRTLRPLLPFRKSEIEEVLIRNFPRATVASDPSNEDASFRRNWFRHNRESLALYGLDDKSLSPLIRTFGNLRSHTDSKAIDFIDQACTHSDLGFAVLDRASFENLDEETKVAVLRRLIAWLSPEGQGLVQIRDKTRLLGTGGTVSHVVVKPSGKGICLFPCQKRSRHYESLGQGSAKGNRFDGRFKAGLSDAISSEFHASYVGRLYADRNLKCIRACLKSSLGFGEKLPSNLIAAMVCLRSKQNPAEFHMPGIKFSSVEKRDFSVSLNSLTTESWSSFGKLVKQRPSSDRFVVV